MKDIDQRHNDFLIKAEEVWQKLNMKFDYSRVDYINNFTKVEIGHPDGYWFFQDPKSHLKGHLPKRDMSRTKATNLKKYGNEWAIASKEVQDTIKESNIRNWGETSTLNVPEIRAKIEATNEEKYGYKNPLLNPDIYQKGKDTLLKNHGVNNAVKIPGILERIQQTNMERYGGKAPISSPIVRNKMNATNQERLGADFPFQNQTIQNKAKATTIGNLDLYWKTKFKDWTSLYNINIIDILSPDEVHLSVYNHAADIIHFICGNCLLEQKVNKETFDYRIEHGGLPCINCNKDAIKEHSSLQQMELYNYLKTITDDTILINDRHIIAPQELDLVLVEHKIAIEYNSLYYHSSDYKDSNYHYNKTIAAKNAGYHLISLFSDEWLTHKDIVKLKLNKIINFYNNEQYIYDKIQTLLKYYKNKDIEITVDNRWNIDSFYINLGFVKIADLPPKLYYIFNNKRQLEYIENGIEILDNGSTIYRWSIM